jgi:hypothetical protein
MTRIRKGGPKQKGNKGEREGGKMEKKGQLKLKSMVKREQKRDRNNLLTYNLYRKLFSVQLILCLILCVYPHKKSFGQSDEAV